MTPRCCRVCHSANVTVAGVVEYLAGFRSTVVDCASCGCRTSDTAPAIHAGLHTVPAISYYASYRALYAEARRLFASGDRDGLEQLLRNHEKYSFVLDRLSALPAGANVLEWGCSRGYLTAMSVLSGRRILGVDVADDAVRAAKDAFGDHFVTDQSSRIDECAPYDAIYHVGLIGCVPDPLALTRRLLTLLRPGGSLFFNAPNLRALHLREQLWMDSAPPPDLVTLFPPGFWRMQLTTVTSVTEVSTPVPAPESTVKTLNRWFGGRWQSPTPHPPDRADAHRWSQPAANRIWQAVEAASAKISATTGWQLGRWPAEFGLYVEVVK